MGPDQRAKKTNPPNVINSGWDPRTAKPDPRSKSWNIDPKNADKVYGEKTPKKLE